MGLPSLLNTLFLKTSLSLNIELIDSAGLEPMSFRDPPASFSIYPIVLRLQICNTPCFYDANQHTNSQFHSKHFTNLARNPVPKVVVIGLSELYKPRDWDANRAPG